MRGHGHRKRSLQEAAVSDAGNSLLLTWGWEQELLAILKFRDVDVEASETYPPIPWCERNKPGSSWRIGNLPEPEGCYPA